MSDKKDIPVFNNADEEAEFWLNNDSADYIDWSKAKKTTFPKLKPSTKTISIRLPNGLLDDIRVLANKKDVPYQSLLKIMLEQAVYNEMHRF